MLKQLRSFAKDDSGTATVEYAVVLALFGMSVIGAFQVVVNESGSQLSNTQNHLQTTALVPPTPAPASP